MRRLGELLSRAALFATVLLAALTTASAARAAPTASFAAPATYGLGTSGQVEPYKMAVGELIPNGRSDVVIATTSNELSVYLSEADGHLAAPQSISLEGAFPTAVTIGDVFGTGIEDIVVATAEPEHILVFPGDGKGDFGSPIASPLPSSGAIESMELGRLVAGSAPYLVTANGSAGSISVIPPGGGGTFESAAAKTYQVSTGLGADVATVRLADFNRDGKLDVAAATSGCGYVNSEVVDVFLGNGDGTLETHPKAEVRDSCAEAMEVADVNHDGNPDIVTVNEEPQSGKGYLATILGKGDGTVGALTASEPVPLPSGRTGLALADFNGDGIADAAFTTSEPSGGELVVVPGTGNGDFAGAQTFPLDASYPGDLVSGDFTGSGTADIVSEDLKCSGCQTSFPPGISIMLQQSSRGKPSPAPPPQPPVTPPQLCSLSTPTTPTKTGKALANVAGKTYELAQVKNTAGPMLFNMFVTARVASPEACVANFELDTVQSFTSKVRHATFTASSPLTPGTHTFWYDPVEGWLYNPAAPQDWGMVGPSKNFYTSWNGAGFVGTPPSIDLSYEHRNATLTIEPLLTLRAPLLETELVHSFLGTAFLELTTSIQPEIYLGLETSLLLPAATCGGLLGTGGDLLDAILGFGSGQRAADAAIAALEVKSVSELEQAAADLFREVPHAVTAAEQIDQAAVDVAQAFGKACSFGYEVGRIAVPASAVVVYFGGEALAALGGVIIDTVATDVGSLVLERVIPAGLKTLSPVAAAAGLRHTTGGGLAASSPTSPRAKPLPTRTADIQTSGLRRGPLARGTLLYAALRELQPFPVPTRVGHLLLSGRLRAGEWVQAVGGRLVDKRRHRVLAVLAGPGYLGVRPVAADRGLAGIDLRLPSRMAAGRWTLAIVDDAGLKPHRGHLGGAVDVRLTTFTVARAVRRRHR